MQRPDHDDRVLNGADTPDEDSPCVQVGRPPIGPQIHFCVTPAEMAQVKRLAADAGWSKAEAGRYFFRRGMADVLRPPQEHGDLRAAVEAQAEAQGMSPAEWLGSAYVRAGGGR